MKMDRRPLTVAGIADVTQYVSRLDPFTDIYPIGNPLQVASVIPVPVIPRDTDPPSSFVLGAVDVPVPDVFLLSILDRPRNGRNKDRPLLAEYVYPRIAVAACRLSTLLTPFCQIELTPSGRS